MNIFRKLFRKCKSQSNSDQNEYEQICQQVIDSLERRDFTDLSNQMYLNMGSYSEILDVHLWLPEMNRMNVTILCDRLVLMEKGIREGVFAITGEVYKYISVSNLEQQSSGFKIVEKANLEKRPNVLLLKVGPEYVKRELVIPNREYVEDGFEWRKDSFSTIAPPIEETTHNVPTSKYRHHFILNFTVLGEFNLDIFFIEKDGKIPVKIFRKSFCCK